MAIITLSSDFGIKDPDLGLLKAQILQKIPQATLIDVSHTLMPFEPVEATYTIQNSLAFFPKGTFHIIAVDSEYHKDHKPILVVTERHFYLGNDNGLIVTALKAQKFQVFELSFSETDRFFSAQISAIKKIIQNKPLEAIGTKTENFSSLKIPNPQILYNDKTQQASVITAKVIYTDNYGNSVVNITKNQFEKWRLGRSFSIKFGIYELRQINENYYPENKNLEITAGNFYARFNQFGYLEIYIYKSNKKTGGANTLLGLQTNTSVNIIFE